MGLGIKQLQSGENETIPNGELQDYYGTETILPNTLIVFSSGNVAPYNGGTINGITQSACTTTQAGKVWVL